MMEHLLTSPKSGFNPSTTRWEVLKQTTSVLNMWTFLVNIIYCKIIYIALAYYELIEVKIT